MFEYQTKVRINLETLRQVKEELKNNYLEINTRETHEGRSRFSMWNNIEKFYERINDGSDSVVIPVTGSATGGTARIYFKPSVTSLSKHFRKCIEPIDPLNQFYFADIKAAEFALGCVFAQEKEAIIAYQNGEDIYMHYSNLFPEGTSRDIIKKILIANLFNKTAYSTSKDLGCTETQAQRLLDSIALRMPSITMLKRKIYAYDMRNKGYFAPNGFDQTDLIKVASIDPVKGFNPDYAANCYIQSALGFHMQKVTSQINSRVSGTFLSVFDSVLIEHKPENFERLHQTLSRYFAPLRFDKPNTGKTFWEAAYSKNN